MDEIDYWSLADQYSVIHATLLIIGCNPDDYGGLISGRVNSKIPTGFNAVRAALTSGVVGGSIEAVTIKWYNNNDYDEQRLDIHETTVNADVLDKFCQAQGFDSEFLERRRLRRGRLGTTAPLKNYPPKLRAAIDAWGAVSSDSVRLKGTSPKAALIKWLTENASEYDLLNRDGTPNELGIQEVAKVANWKPKGGANPTPSAAVAPTSVPKPIRIPVQTPALTGTRESLPVDLDDEIPF
jgi:hypothetical protein